MPIAAERDQEGGYECGVDRGVVSSFEMAEQPPRGDFRTAARVAFSAGRVRRDLPSDATGRQSRHAGPATCVGKVGVTLVSVLLLVVAVFLAAAPALAEPPAAYLAEMPSSQQVLTKIKGKDRLDTLARQYAAFERLGAIMGVLEGSREFDPAPSEVRVTSEYHEQAGQIQTQATSSVSSADKPKWFALAWGYESDKKFNRQLMTTFFSPSFRARYDTSVQTAASQRSAAKAATTAAAEAAAKAADDTSGQVNPLWVWLGGGAAFVLLVGLITFSRITAFRLGWWWPGDRW